ncbi:MAG TPA: NUDIX hydrolase [Thermoguttaceae bacterium]|nr:NUDIX hydrolase [Thermoguttaceae bacterium]
MPHESWTLLGSQDVSDERIFRIRHDRYRFEPTAAERDFVVLDSPDWVNVVPVTPDGRVVLIRQYRHGIRRVTLEIPGGMVDPNESPQDAAVRELEEETGYVADRVRLLGRVTPNPAIQNNRCHMFLAEGCRRLAEPKPDPFERIEVVLRPLEDIPEMVRSEEISHGLVLNAFAWVVRLV